MFVTMLLLSLLLLNLASVEAVEPFELIMGRLSAADRSDPDQARPAHIHTHTHTHTYTQIHTHTHTHIDKQTYTDTQTKKIHTDSSSYRVLFVFQ